MMSFNLVVWCQYSPFLFLIKNIFVTLLFIHQIWNIKSAECLHTFQGGIGGSAGGVRCNSVHIQPRQPDHFILCNKSSTIFVMNLQGQVNHFSINSLKSIFDYFFILYMFLAGRFH